MTEAAWVLASFAAGIGLVALVLGIWHVLAIRPVGPPPPAPVTLILALTGDQPGLGALFAALAAQSFRARRLILAVESPWDPAAAQAEALAAQLPFPLTIVVAAEARETAQKCANLAAAFGALDGQDAAVVVFDGDIRPGPHWLGALVGPVLDGRFDVVTGYRWLMPGRGGASAQLVAWLDRGAAMMPKPPSLGPVWGGSTAYSPKAVTQIDFPRLYTRQLVDDLPAGMKARALGLRLLTRRIILLRVSSDARGFGFYRRQYQYGWRYKPMMMAIALTLAVLVASGWWAALGLAVNSPAAALLLFGMLGGRLGQWALQRQVARVIETPDPAVTARRQLAVALLAPFSTLALPLLMLAALPARRMEWRNIVYAIRGSEAVRVIWRLPWEQPPPCPITGERNAVRLGTMPTTALCRLWLTACRLWPTPLAQGKRIDFWRSPTGLIFCHPMMEGDAAFRRSLSRHLKIRKVHDHDAAPGPAFIAAARHITPGAKVLEIGAGTGAFAQHLPKGARHIGLDPHAAHGAHEHDAPVETGPLQDYAATHAGQFDMACAFQVIGHLADPLGTTRDMLRCLRPGGLIILVAPLWPSPLTRIPNFPLNLPPYHLTCWNPDALRALMTAAGAEPVALHPLPAGPPMGRFLWMARLSPVKAPVDGPWFAARWTWHFSLALAWLLSFPATWLRSSPQGAEPVEVLVVARKPLSDVPEASAGAAMGAASGASLA